jgi:uncharacterized protein
MSISLPHRGQKITSLTLDVALPIITAKLHPVVWWGAKMKSSTQINVAQLLRQPVGTTRSYLIDHNAEVAEQEIKNYHAWGMVELLRTDRSILVRGTLEGIASLVCSRCLTLFDQPLTLDIAEEFFPGAEMSGDFPVPSPQELGSFTIGERHILDLSEVVRQSILLAIGMKPLCRPDCAGLCLYCGTNLNLSRCSCTPVPQHHHEG